MPLTEYDHVTTILDAWIDPELLKWQLEVGRATASKVSKKAMKIGSRVDELIRADIDSGKLKLRKSDSNEVANCMVGWEKFKKEKQMKVVSHHQRHQSEEWLVSGEYDLEYPLHMTDVKCASAIRKKNWIQTAVYNHISLLNKPKLAILRLDPFWATYEWKEKVMSVGYLKVFQGMIHVMRYFNCKEEFV